MTRNATTVIIKQRQASRKTCQPQAGTERVTQWEQLRRLPWGTLQSRGTPLPPGVDAPWVFQDPYRALQPNCLIPAWVDMSLANRYILILTPSTPSECDLTWEKGLCGDD